MELLKVSQDLLKPVINWANSNYKTFIPNGFGRQYGVLEDLNPPKEVFTIRELIINYFGLQNTERELTIKDYCGYVTDGGAIHKHKDPNKESKAHTRFNVMVSKPIFGGTPVEDGQHIFVKEGDVWKCNAGLKEHWCTPVEGPKPRIVLSYGFLV